ncbi:MAG TPA: 50S ribosomal protein L29 [Candidatus Omnitrophota bacterium]|nr:50S ribosomal protein L29 [Candidatus Omnitrophota bacterium]
MAKVADFQNLTKEELVEKEGQLKKQLMQLRFDAKLGKLEKHSTIRDLRRDIARVLTVMNQKRSAS